MDPRSIGFVAGTMIGVILVVLLFKFANKDGKIKTEYDERQNAVRGKAYKYALYTEVAAQAVVMWLMMTNIELPIEDYGLVFIAIIIGLTVLAAYCIWKDVYWGLNNNRKRYHIILLVAVILNFFPVVMNIKMGTLMENGKIGMSLFNIVVLAMMAVVHIELVIKAIVDKKADEEG